MMRKLASSLILVAFLLASPAYAQQPKTDPITHALGQMLSEAQTREAQANIRAFSAEARVAELTAEVAQLKSASLAHDADAAKATAVGPVAK